MSYFNSNITGGSGGASGLVTKFVKTITISSSALAEATIDISHDITNYKDIINDNIIIELNNASAIAAGDAELSHAYNAETGVITITSTNSNIPFASNSVVELSVNVYVAGAVQMPPAPDSAVYDLGTGTKFNVKGYAGYSSFTVNNFIVGVESMPPTDVDYPGNNRQARATGFTLTKSYDNLNGILTVNGSTQTITYVSGEKSATQQGVVHCYLVLGAIE